MLAFREMIHSIFLLTRLIFMQQRHVASRSLFFIWLQCIIDSIVSRFLFWKSYSSLFHFFFFFSHLELCYAYHLADFIVENGQILALRNRSLELDLVFRIVGSLYKLAAISLNIKANLFRWCNIHNDCTCKHITLIIYAYISVFHRAYQIETYSNTYTCEFTWITF